MPQRPCFRSIAASLLFALSLTACTVPVRKASAPTPYATATPVSPLASSTIYWSEGAYLWALRASDGKTLWRHGGGASLASEGNGFVYLTSRDSNRNPAAFSLRASDGQVQWTTLLTGCVWSDAPVNGNVAPLLLDGVVIVMTTGHFSGGVPCGGDTGWVYALRASDGGVLWKTPIEKAPLAIVGSTSDMVIVSAFTEPGITSAPLISYLIGIRVSDGKIIWHTPGTYHGPIGEVGRFVVAAGTVFVARNTRAIDAVNARSVNSLAMQAVRVNDGTQVWMTPERRDISPISVALANGMGYIATSDGDIAALHMADGTEAWRIRSRLKISGPMTVSGNLLYMGVQGNLDVLDATTGTLLHAFPVLTPSDANPQMVVFGWTQPTLLPGVILAGGHACTVLACEVWAHTLYAMDSTSGDILWQRSDLNVFQ